MGNVRRKWASLSLLPLTFEIGPFAGSALGLVADSLDEFVECFENLCLVSAQMIYVGSVGHDIPLTRSLYHGWLAHTLLSNNMSSPTTFESE